jgi:nucleotide-binding universal stress UspA family protein
VLFVIFVVNPHWPTPICMGLSWNHEEREAAGLPTNDELPLGEQRPASVERWNGCSRTSFSPLVVRRSISHPSLHFCHSCTPMSPNGRVRRARNTSHGKNGGCAQISFPLVELISLQLIGAARDYWRSCNQARETMGWLPKNRIVVPVDFSDESLAAVDTALLMVGSAKDVHLVHVLRELSPLEPGEVWETVTTEDRMDFARRSLQARLSDPKYADLNYKILLGDPGHQIAEYAEQVEADLIVLPSHGRTGLSHLLIGSVAERVVRLAHCGVLVLRK